MTFIRVTINCAQDFAEILIAELSEVGFDSFTETSTGVECFAEEERFDESVVTEIIERYQHQSAISFTIDKIEKRNWNEEWEKSYEPINIENKVLIRAHFHQTEKQFPFEIIISPKMSFGTGHHQTTYLMIMNQLHIDHKNKHVMDAGCGTGILSIMASKLGAKSVDSFDIDEWSIINASENIEVNSCENIHIQKGKLSELDFTEKFDIILANINKNILLEELPQYVGQLNPKGMLLMSGFYEYDIDELAEKGASLGLQKIRNEAKESWASLLLKRN
jgi:ribosomal protein L11 methyltransferase